MLGLASESAMAGIFNTCDNCLNTLRDYKDYNDKPCKASTYVIGMPGKDLWPGFGSDGSCVSPSTMKGYMEEDCAAAGYSCVTNVVIQGPIKNVTCTSPTDACSDGDNSFCVHDTVTGHIFGDLTAIADCGNI